MFTDPFTTDEAAAIVAAADTAGPKYVRKNRADKRREGHRGEGRHLRARPGKLAPHPLAARAEVTE